MIIISNMNGMDFPMNRVTADISTGSTGWGVDGAGDSEWSEKSDISQEFSMRSYG